MSRKITVLLAAFLSTGYPAIALASDDVQVAKPRLPAILRSQTIDLLSLMNTEFSLKNRHFDYPTPEKRVPSRHSHAQVTTLQSLTPRTPIAYEKENQPGQINKSTAEATTILLAKTKVLRPVARNSRAIKTLNYTFDDELRTEIADLKAELKKVRALNQALASRWMSSTEDAEEHFMQCFSVMTGAEVEAYYLTFLTHIKDTTPVDSAKKKLSELWEQLHNKMTMSNYQLTDKCYEAHLILTKQAEAMFANDQYSDLYQAGHDLSEDFRSRIESWYASSIREEYVRMHLSEKHFLIREGGLRVGSGRDRMVPVLLYLLRVDPAKLSTVGAFDVSNWARLQRFIPFLTMPQRIAMYQHIAVGLELNASEGETYTTVLKQEKIKRFMSVLRQGIDKSSVQETMDMDDVQYFNKELLGLFKTLLGISR